MHVVYVMDGSFGFKPGSFTTAIIEAISKADLQNFSRLSSIYPELCDSVKRWKEGNLYELTQRAFDAQEKQKLVRLIP